MESCGSKSPGLFPHSSIQSSEVGGSHFKNMSHVRSGYTRLTLIPPVTTNSSGSQVSLSLLSFLPLPLPLSTVYIMQYTACILHYTHVDIDAGHHVLHSLHCNCKCNYQESCSSRGHSHHCLCYIHQYLNADKWTLSLVTVWCYVYNSACAYTPLFELIYKFYMAYSYRVWRTVVEITFSTVCSSPSFCTLTLFRINTCSTIDTLFTAHSCETILASPIKICQYFIKFNVLRIDLRTQVNGLLESA